MDAEFQHMGEAYYPWGGEFTTGKADGTVAVVLLNIEYQPPPSVAIYGSLKTENIGIEKIVANVVSNPYIRYLVVCGEDIRGHRSGASLLALHRAGIDTNHRIIEAPGAIPYIENISQETIERFQAQVAVVDLIGERDASMVEAQISSCERAKAPSFGEPYIAIRIKPEVTVNLSDARALHARIRIDARGKVATRRS